MHSLLGIPILVLGVLMIWFHRPLGTRSRRFNTWAARPFGGANTLWGRGIDPGERFSQVVALLVGVGWSVAGVLVQLGVGD
jgi:hypothetical protein